VEFSLTEVFNRPCPGATCSRRSSARTSIWWGFQGQPGLRLEQRQTPAGDFPHPGHHPTRGSPLRCMSATDPPRSCSTLPGNAAPSPGIPRPYRPSAAPRHWATAPSPPLLPRLRRDASREMPLRYSQCSAAYTGGLSRTYGGVRGSASAVPLSVLATTVRLPVLSRMAHSRTVGPHLRPRIGVLSGSRIQIPPALPLGLLLLRRCISILPYRQPFRARHELGRQTKPYKQWLPCGSYSWLLA
jgi:hypothetical protein